MATTTNYGWTTPDDTALVKDGASAIRTLGSSVDTTTKNLNPSTTLGDLEYRSATANTNTRLGIGTTNQILTVVGGVPAWAAAPASSPTFNGVVVKNNASQTIPNTTATVCTWDLEYFDTNTYHSTSSNTSRLTVPSTGYYFVYAKLRWQSNATGYRYMYFTKNGVQIQQDYLNYPDQNNPFTLYYGIVTSASATDYLEVFAAQNSGGNLSVRGDDDGGSLFGAYYLGA